MSNDFSMASTALAFCMPELGEALSAWHSRATKPVIIEQYVLIRDTVKPEPNLTLVPEQKAANAAHVAANAIDPSKIAPINHAAPLAQLPETGAKNDDIQEFLDLADSTLNDADLQAVIDGLIAIRNHRNAIKLAA